MKNKHLQNLPSAYSVISELRTPLVEIQLANMQGDNHASCEISKQTVKLFESLLYAQKLEQLDNRDFTYTPYSLVAATEDSLNDIYSFAKLYDIKLQLEFDHAHKKSVGLIKPAFDHATFSLLHAIINALQNYAKSTIRIKIDHKDLPTIRFFSSKLSLDRQKNQANFNQDLSVCCSSKMSGTSGGLFISQFIYNKIGSGVNFIANQYGQGLRIDFRTINQLSLMGA